MPTSYTSLLGLALPVTGELAGTWGDTVNDYISKYVDSSVAGTQTISGSQTAVTLTRANGAALSQAGSGATGSSQYQVINCTGNPAGTLTVTIDVSTGSPALSNSTYSQTFAVINGTSTSQSVVVRATTSSGTSTGTTLVSGEKALIAWNGSDFIKVATSAVDGVSTIAFGTTGLTPSSATSGAVTVAGTLVAANGGTGQSSYTTGDLLYATGSTALSKLGIGTNGQILTSTGTAPQWSTLSGVAVTTFSAGTTGFTPSSATSGAVTLAGTLATTNGGTGLTSFTANGVVYASSTSALTTGSALTFDGSQFFANSNSTTTPGFFQVNDGTTTQANSFVTIARNANDGNGRYSLSAWRAQNASGLTQYSYIGTQSVAGAANYTPEMVFGLSTGASTYAEQMRLTSTGLGIGTSSPTASAKLELVGGNLRIRNTNNTASSNTTFWNGDYVGAFLWNQSNTSGAVAGIQFVNGASANGNAGIGGVAEAATPTTSALAFYTGGSGVSNTVPERMRISSAGDVGIGTSSPAYKLDVNGSGNIIRAINSSTTAALMLATNSGASSILVMGNEATTAGSSAVGSSSYAGLLFTTGARSLQFGTNSTIQATIDSSGNVGIGTSSPGQRLTVAGNEVAAQKINAVGTVYASGAFLNAFSTAGGNEIGFSGFIASQSLNTTNRLWMGVHSPSGANQSFVGNPDATPLAFWTNSTERARVTSDGRVCIGGSTVTDTHLLNIQGSSASHNIGIVLNKTNATAQVWGITNTGPLAFYNYTTASEAARFDTSNNFGIGTSSPGYKLDVNGTFGLGTGQTGNVGVFGANTATADTYFRIRNTAGAFDVGTSALEHYFYGQGALPLKFFTNSTLRATLDSSGNLGIGTSSPTNYQPFGYGPTVEASGGYSGSFIVSSSSQTYKGGMKLYGASGDTIIGSISSNKLHFTTADAAPQMTLDTSGNLGIGTSPTAGYKLDVNGNINIQGATPTINASNSNAVLTIAQSSGASGRLELQGAESIRFTTYLSSWSERGRFSSDGTFRVKGAGTAGSTDAVQFAGTAPASAMSLDSSGNLLVGTTSAGGGANVKGVTVNNAGQIAVERDGGIAGVFNRFTSDGAIIIFRRSATQVGSIDVTTTATSYVTSSDYRLKNITGPVTNSGAYIDALKPVEGTWKADGSTFVGLIAHEAQEVSRTKVATGTKDGEEMQGMDYSNAEFIANIIAELQSLRARVAQLEAK